MAVSTRDEGVHKHSSPARSMLDGPQQSAPDVASPQHSAGAHCSTGTDRCGALLVVSPSASHGTSPRVPESIAPCSIVLACPYPGEAHARIDSSVNFGSSPTPAPLHIGHTTPNY